MMHFYGIVKKCSSFSEPENGLQTHVLKEHKTVRHLSFTSLNISTPKVYSSTDTITNEKRFCLDTATKEIFKRNKDKYGPGKS